MSAYPSHPACIQATPHAHSTDAAATPATGLPLVLDSSTLLQGQRTIAIAHNGAVYRLQATRQGKLILTK